MRDHRRGAFAGFFHREFADHLQLAAIVKLEIILGQISNRSAVFIAHHHGDVHQIDASAERDRDFLLRDIALILPSRQHQDRED